MEHAIVTTKIVEQDRASTIITLYTRDGEDSLANGMELQSFERNAQARDYAENTALRLSGGSALFTTRPGWVKVDPDDEPHTGRSAWVWREESPTC